MVGQGSKFYTVQEVAQILGIHQKTVYRLIKEDRLHAHRIGSRHWRISQKSLCDFIGEGGEDNE
jgi:excisionase family DNA binding protein